MSPYLQVGIGIDLYSLFSFVPQNVWKDFVFTLIISKIFFQLNIETNVINYWIRAYGNVHYKHLYVSEIA